MFLTSVAIVTVVFLTTLAKVVMFLAHFSHNNRHVDYYYVFPLMFNGCVLYFRHHPRSFRPLYLCRLSKIPTVSYTRLLPVRRYPTSISVQRDLLHWSVHRPCCTDHQQPRLKTGIIHSACKLPNISNIHHCFYAEICSCLLYTTLAIW